MMAHQENISEVSICSPPFLLTMLSDAVDGIPGFSAARSFNSVDELISTSEKLTAGVVLLSAEKDFSPPEGAGYLEAVRNAHPQVGILFFDLRPASPHRAWSVMRRGSLGYLCLSDPPEQLALALPELAQGRPYLNPSLGSQIAMLDQDTISPLSPRESQVLHMLAFGFTNPQIAESMGLSVRTIEAHRASINSKMGFTSRSELVRYALDNHILG